MNNEVNNVQYGVPVQAPKKSNKTLWIVLGVVGGLFVLGILGIAAIIFLFAVVVNSHPYYGNWVCGSDSSVKLQIDANNFKMQYGTSGDIEATYTVDTEVTNTVTKYNITAKATKRIINGVTYTSPYTTKFQIIMDKGNNSMVMMNTISYSTYTCRREK